MGVIAHQQHSAVVGGEMRHRVANSGVSTLSRKCLIDLPVWSFRPSDSRRTLEPGRRGHECPIERLGALIDSGPHLAQQAFENLVIAEEAIEIAAGVAGFAIEGIDRLHVQCELFGRRIRRTRL